MSRSQPPTRVPTLTEVLAEQPSAAGAAPGRPISTSDIRRRAARSVAAGEAGADAQAEMARRIAADLQAHIDRVLEARVRAALAPVLEQTVTRVVEESRRELASTLRDAIAEVLARQSSGHRGRP